MPAPEVGEVALGATVRVEWYDAWSDEGQTKRQDWHDDMRVETVGTLERDTARIVSVAAERFPDEEDTFRSVTHIPRGIVESIKVLE